MGGLGLVPAALIQMRLGQKSLGLCKRDLGEFFQETLPLGLSASQSGSPFDLRWLVVGQLLARQKGRPNPLTSGVGQQLCLTEKGRSHALTSMQNLADNTMGLANKKARSGASQKRASFFVKNHSPPESEPPLRDAQNPHVGENLLNTWLFWLPPFRVTAVLQNLRLYPNR